MRIAAAEERKVLIRPGFSPKPVAAIAPMMASSPSRDPETLSPNALLDGPLVQRIAVPESKEGTIVQNGIVSFGK